MRYVFVLPVKVLIACHHIEISAGKVAFVFIGRLKHVFRAAALPADRVSHQHKIVVEGDSRRRHLAERIVQFR